MQSRENTESDLLDLTLRRLLYGNTTTYAYECGGLTPSIRNLTLSQIRDYHASFYHPSNLTTILTGDSISHPRILARLAIEPNLFNAQSPPVPLPPISTPSLPSGP